MAKLKPFLVSDEMLLRCRKQRDQRSVLIEWQLLSDIKLQFYSETVPAYSEILKEKSEWFKENCAGEELLRLDDLPDNMLEHFCLQDIRDYYPEMLLLIMIRFCYQRKYGLPKSINSQDAPQYMQESAMILHVYMHLLARQYSIESLLVHTWRELRTMASRLRAMRSHRFAVMCLRLSNYPGFVFGDDMKEFGLDELKLISQENNGGVQMAKCQTLCHNCHTIFDVIWCMNCAWDSASSDGYEDEDEDEDMDEDTEEQSDTKSTPTV